MGLYNSFATDPNLENNGAVFIYPDLERQDPEAYRVTLRHLTGRSSIYKKVRERVMKPYQHFKSEEISEDTRDITGREIFVEAGIAKFETRVYKDAWLDESFGERAVGDWVNGCPIQVDGREKIVPSTKDNLIAMCAGAPLFMGIMFSDSNAVEHYRVRRREDASKNS